MCEQNTSKVLKDNLIILRRRSRMTQEQLAGKLGLTFQAVSKWENGLSCPDITLLPQIAEIFGVTVDELFRPISLDEPAEKEPSEPEKAVAAEPVEPESAEGSGTEREEPPENFGEFLGQVISRRVQEALKKLEGSEFTRQIAQQVETAEQGWEQTARQEICRESGKGVSVDGLPWEDDDIYRAVLFRGKTLVTVPAEEKGRLCWHEDLDQKLLSAFRVECGDVMGDVCSMGSVECGDIAGSTSAGTFIQCSDIAGPVSAGGKVECGDVGGSVSAGGSVECGDVGDTVSAGNGVTCGDVDGDVKAGGNVTADTIEGDVRADTVTCGEIGGDVTCRDIRQ